MVLHTIHLYRIVQHQTSLKLKSMYMVQNMDYGKLAANKTMYNAFYSSVQSAIAASAGAGITAAHVLHLTST